MIKKSEKLVMLIDPLSFSRIISMNILRQKACKIARLIRYNNLKIQVNFCSLV